MNINAIQANSKLLELSQTIAANVQANLGGVAHSSVVEPISGGYRAYVVPSVPGINANGSSISEAEANLAAILDILA